MNSPTISEHKIGRYAVYVSPSLKSPLGEFGHAWLGRNVESCESLERPILSDWSADEISYFTKEPARYGFHMTLRSPFRLNEGVLFHNIYDVLQRLVAKSPPVHIPQWKVGVLGSFIALMPAAPNHQLNALEALLLEGLDSCRQPPTPDELARRRNADLTVQEDALLMRWGYPYVMDAFRPHFTLTGAMPSSERARLLAALQSRMADLTGPYTITEVAVFAEPKGGGDFVLLERFSLSG